MRRFGRIIAFVTLLCALTIGSLEGRTGTELLDNEAHSDSFSLEIDEYTAKWSWVNCKVDLMATERIDEGADLCCSGGMTICAKASKSGKQYLFIKNLRKENSVLSPHMKQTLLDCLRKQNIVFHVSEKEDGYNSWHAKYLEYLFKWPDASRRYLSDEPPGITATPTPSPFPSPSPSPSPKKLLCFTLWLTKAQDIP